MDGLLGGISFVGFKFEGVGEDFKFDLVVFKFGLVNFDVLFNKFNVVIIDFVGIVGGKGLVGINGLYVVLLFGLDLVCILVMGSYGENNLVVMVILVWY